MAGSALASHDSGGSRVYFIGNDNHVHELAWADQQGQWVWNTTDLTATAKDANDNDPPSAIADSALASHDSGGSRVYFIGKDPTSGDDHVYEIAWLGSIWNYTPLTTVTGAPSAIAGSALASHDSGGSRVYFISGDNHVIEIASQGTWNYTDLTDVTTPPNQSWMTDLANSTPGFPDFKLSQICFPGTHDSGTYSLRHLQRIPPWVRIRLSWTQ